MKKVMQSEVRRTWEEKREKITKKVNFLQKKWGRKRPDLAREEKVWQGVRY